MDSRCLGTTDHWKAAHVVAAGHVVAAPAGLRRFGLVVCLPWVVLVLTQLAWMTGALAIDTDWSLQRLDESNDIRIETRRRDDGFTEFRGVTRVRSRLAGLVALLQDFDRHAEWVYRTRASRAVERLGDREVIVYSVARMVWPFADRDLVMHTHLTQDPRSHTIIIEGDAWPGFLAPVPGLVRVPLLRSSWRFEPLPDGRIEIGFQGFGDGGGNLSSGLLNWFSTRVLAEAPHQTLIGLRRMIGRDEYQQARFDWLREPGFQGMSNLDSIRRASSK